MPVLEALAPEFGRLRQQLNDGFQRLGEDLLARRDGDGAALALWQKAALDLVPTQFWDAPMRALLVDVALTHATRLRSAHDPAWPEVLSQAADLAHDPNLRSEMLAVTTRLEEVEDLLGHLADGSAGKKYSRFFKRKVAATDARAFMTLLADAADMTWPWHEVWDDDGLSPFLKSDALETLHKLISRITSSKTWQALMPVGEVFGPFVQCDCPDCQVGILENALPRAREVFGLPRTEIPQLARNQAPAAAASLSGPGPMAVPDPFAALGVARHATKPEILRRTMERMREKPDQLVALRQAQAELFDGSRRLVHEFLRFLEPEPANLSGVKAPEAGSSLGKIRLRGKWSRYDPAAH
jgi:hypothetical protein